MDIYRWLDDIQHHGPSPDVVDYHSTRRPANSTGRRPERETIAAISHAYLKSGTLVAAPATGRKRVRAEGTASESDGSRSESSSSASDTSSSRHPAISEHFERRKRHKMREDLYEPNAGVEKKRSKPKNKKKQKKKDKHHRTERTKRAAKPGQQLLKNFSAPNMGGTRLTVRVLSHLPC